MKDTLGPSQAHREPEVGAILAQQVRGPIRAALIDLINQKRAGKPIVPQERPRGENVVDLMEALRKSVGGAGSESNSEEGPQEAMEERTRLDRPYQVREMLADPRHSRVVLINLTRGKRANVTAEFAARRRASLTLLPFCQEMFAVGQTAVGEYEPGQLAEQVAHSIATLHIDDLSLWRDQRFTDSLVASNTGVIFLGGAWLEEEIFIAALEGVRRGYDVRLLADLSIPRLEADRSLVLDRLALHGVLTTTVRQALLEWAVCLDDASLTQRVRQLLS